MTSAPGRCAIFVSLAAWHRTTDQLEDLHDQRMTARAAVMRSDCETWRRFRHEGIAAAAQILADLAGATITVDDLGFTLTMDAR